MATEKEEESSVSETSINLQSAYKRRRILSSSSEDVSNNASEELFLPSTIRRVWIESDNQSESDEDITNQNSVRKHNENIEWLENIQ